MTKALRMQTSKPSLLRLRPLIGALALLTGLSCSVRAADIDIYSGGGEGVLPNILFFMDNTSNWSAANQAWTASSMYAKALANAQTECGKLANDCIAAALIEPKRLIDAIFYYGIAASSAGGQKRPWESGFAANKDDVSLKQGQVEMRTLRLVLTTFVCTGEADALQLNIGLMFFNDMGSVRSNGDRPGYIRRAVKPMNTANCAAFIKDLTYIDEHITDPEFKGPANADYGSAFYEAFKYFGGYTNPNKLESAGAPIGPQGYGPQRFSNVNPLEDSEAFVDQAKTTYKSPFDMAGCNKSYLVLVGNGYPNFEPTGPAKFGGLDYTPAPALSADASRFADEWSQFLANTDVSPAMGIQQVNTYAFNIFKDQPSANQRRLLESIGTVGGVESGGYVEVDGDLTKLFESFKALILNVAAVNSVFTATTLPVSTTTQGSFLNQLFIGMFRPDGSAKPRWVGNLKQYKLGMQADGEVVLVDQAGKPALQGGAGFFSPLSTSFWTKESVYFTNNKSGTPESASDAPDGQIVEKGGAAQRLRQDNLLNADARRMFTLPAKEGLALSTAPFDNTTAAVKTAFGNDDIISWIRGENNVAAGEGKEFAGAYTSDSKVLNLGTRGARPSIHGDVLHSRPVAVNYGNGSVVVYYGANDGVLRAVDGSQTSTDGGRELWSFIAPEHYDMIKRQRDNEPALYLPSTDASGGPAGQFDGTKEKDYGFDGPIGLSGVYSSTTGRLISGSIYAAMRRGGRALYSFDITNPVAPVFRWKKSNEDAGYGKLAQTWSMPRPVVFPGAAAPYLMMGGGYDPAEDKNSSSGLGNRVYVIDSSDGKVLKELETEFSVPGDVTVVDLNGDRIFDRAYVADVRGGLYRISMTDPQGVLMPVASWTIKKIASLGGKVFHAPDVVVTKYYVSLLVGTGDREKPLMTTSSDKFFMVKDTLMSEPDRTTVMGVSDFTRVAKVSESSTDVAAFTDVNENVDDPEGCYLELSTKGEKVVNTPFTIAGATYFGTNRPMTDPLSCTGSLGQARTYTFPLFCGVPKGVVLEGGGMPPSPVGGLVNMTVTVNGKDEERLVPVIIGSGARKSAHESGRVRPPISPARKRNFWHINDNNR